MILGHCEIHRGLLLWLYSFHMPLFFFLSGYVAALNENHKMGREAVKAMTKKLLYPYYVIGFLIIVYNTIGDYLIMRSFSLQMVGKRVLALLYGNCIWENNYDYIGTLWFLAALFCVKLLYLAVLNIKNLTLRHLTAAGVVLVGCLWRKVFESGIRLPMSFDVALLAFCFYYLGSQSCGGGVLQAEERRYSIRRIVACILALVYGSCLAFLNCDLAKIEATNLYGMTLGYALLYFPTALLIIVSLLGLSVAVFNGRQKAVLNVLPEIGKRSLLIMAFHIYVKQISNYIFRDILSIEITGYVMTALTLAVTYMAAVIVERFLPFIYRFPDARRI